MQLSFSVLGTGARSGQHIVSLVPDVVWHRGASAPLKHCASIEPHTEESRRKQGEAHHKETLQTSDTKPSGDGWVCKRFAQEGSFKTGGYNEGSVTCGEECCE